MLFYHRHARDCDLTRGSPIPRRFVAKVIFTCGVLREALIQCGEGAPLEPQGLRGIDLN